jgi:hypothetical protein
MSSDTLPTVDLSALDVETDFSQPDYFNPVSTDIQRRMAFLTEVWNHFAPELDLRYGVYNSTVLSPAAIFSQGVIDSIERWRDNTQVAALLDRLQNLSADDAERVADLLDLFLLNYRVTRNAGSNATGRVVLLFDKDISYVIGSSDSFTAKQLTFNPVNSFGIVPSTRSALTSNEQSLIPRSDGLYSAVITVICDDTTTSANLAAGTQLLPVRSISGLIGAYAESTFTGGSNETSLEELYQKIIYGISSPVMSTRTNMSSLLRSQIDLLPIHSDSIVGLGDIEMIRDQHSIYPISCGGRADWYVRTSQNIVSALFSKTARRVAVLTENSARWRVLIDRNDLPGLYSINEIRTPELADPLEKTYEYRSYNLTDYKIAPDIVTPEEAAFTRFQTLVVEFIDPLMSRFGDIADWPEEKTYNFLADSMPRLAEIQEYVSAKSNVSVLGDVLIKAPIPCKVKIDFAVCAQPTQEIPSDAIIQGTVVDTIHAAGFTNNLAASVIIRAVQDLLPTDAFIEDFTMTGSLLLPTGKTITKTDIENLEFYEPPYATAKTISFFSDLNSVTVNTKTVMTAARFL